MVKVSVLVPIYNVEEYLPECLNSLVNQTLKQIEIICINDGSTDDSLAVVKQYAKKDDRIIIIDKKNSGYGDSMNQGLAKASGEYVAIVESDDFIDVDAFEVMYKTASRNKVEVLKGNFYNYFGESDEDMNSSSLFLPDETGRIINPRVNRNIFLQQPSIWAAIYNRKFLEKNDIKFLPTPGASYQDLGFNFKVWASASRAFFMERSFLHYRNDNSNSSIRSSGKIFAVRDEYEGIKEYLEQHDYFEDLKKEYYACIISSYTWNLERLTYRSARKFAPEMCKALKDGKKNGAIGKKDAIFDQRYRIAKHPKVYLVRTRIVKQIKPFVSKVMKVIFPTYRHRLQILDRVKGLQESQRHLARQVNKLKNENAELKKKLEEK